MNGSTIKIKNDAGMLTANEIIILILRTELCFDTVITRVYDRHKIQESN